MLVVTKEEFLLEKEKYFDLIREGRIFIYPTDTIYGIGCSALHEGAVQKIREVKDRSVAPFSVIAPSQEWILANLETEGKAKDWLNKLPGPYTLIMKKKEDFCVAKPVSGDYPTLGVRIPEHWMSKLVAELGVPIVTTSVNKKGKEFMVNLETLDSDIKHCVDFAIDVGECKGMPSNIIHLEGEETLIKERQKGSKEARKV
jgi:L-threonylcarbamoyladenylate synthase